MTEHGPSTQSSGNLGDASISNEVVTSRTYATGDTSAPYMTVESTHGVQAQVTGGPDFATRNPLAFTDWEEERLARTHLAEQEDQLRQLRGSIGLVDGDDLKDLQRDIAQRERYVAELRDQSPGKLTYYTASQLSWTVHTDADDPGGTEVHSGYDYDEGDLYFERLGNAERQTYGDSQRAFDHLATVNFDWPGKAS